MESTVKLIKDKLTLNMAFSESSIHATTAGSWISQSVAMSAIYFTHTLYPIVLLLLFFALFAAHGVLTASTDTSISRPPPNITGPGGKPLPDTRTSTEKKAQLPAFSITKRLSFIWLSVGLVLTFFGNAANIIVHALTEEWWCGEAAAVSSSKQQKLQ